MVLAASTPPSHCALRRTRPPPLKLRRARLPWPRLRPVRALLCAANSARLGTTPGPRFFCINMKTGAFKLNKSASISFQAGCGRVLCISLVLNGIHRVLGKECSVLARSGFFVHSVVSVGPDFGKGGGHGLVVKCTGYVNTEDNKCKYLLCGEHSNACWRSNGGSWR